MLALVLLFMAGVWCGLVIDLPAWRAVAAGAALLALWSLTRRLDASGAAQVSVPLVAASFFAGWALAAAQMGDRRQGPLADWVRGRSARVVLLGRVVDDPEGVDAAPRKPAGDRTQAAARGTRVAWQFTLQAERVRLESDPASVSFPVAAPVTVRWTAFEDEPQPAYGDCLLLAGVLYSNSRNTSALNALCRQRIQLRASCRNTEWMPEGRRANPFIAWCYRQRSFVRQYLSAGIRDFPRHTSFLNALVLGYRQDLPRDIHDDFTATNTLHILAISGSHVMVIASILIVVLQAAGVSRVRWIWTVAPLLVAYTVATGLSASAVRACIMAIILFAAPSLRRRADILTSLAFGAFLILAADPSQLFDLGALLSFASVLGLVVLCPVLEKPLQRRLEPDPLRMQPERRPARWARAAARWAVSLVVLTLAAWLVSTPLTAFFFHRFSLAALPANLILIPLAFLILLSGCLSLVLGPVWMFLADLFNHANLFLVEALLRTLHAMARLPGGSVEVPHLPLGALVLYYIVLALAVWRLREIQRRRPLGTDK